MFIMIGFSCFSWTIGYFFIKYKIDNPRFERDTSVADIVTCYQALIFAMFTVMTIQSLYPAMIRALTVGREVLDVIGREPLIISPEDKSECVTNIQIQDGIKFQDVQFRYPTAPETVKDIFTGASFMIKSGTTTAIVGPSGAGKSTIVQLINRFYDPSEGSITYGSTPLTSIDLPALRKTIGWVGQEPVLVVGTIKENLLYGNHTATDEQIRRAIELASADFVLNELEKGLDTYVGSSTVLNLSGG